MKTVRPHRRRRSPAPQVLDTDRGHACPYCGDRYFYMKKHLKYCKADVPHGTISRAVEAVDQQLPFPILPVGLKDA